MKKDKIYGAIDLNLNGDFIGFSKHIFGNEILKVKILLNGEELNTLIANKTIYEVELKYEMFDTDGFCFEFPMPKSLNKGDILEFLAQDNTHLLNSPITV